MIRRSGGISRKKGGDWEEYWCPAPTDSAEAESGCALYAPDLPTRIKYPTIAEVSENLRQDSELTHTQLIDLLAAAGSAFGSVMDLRSKGWTQEAIAKHLGLSQTTICRLVGIYA